MSRKKKICVIGAGNWGKNHIRILKELGVLGGIVEKTHERLLLLKDKYETDKKIKKVFSPILIFFLPNVASLMSLIL